MTKNYFVWSAIGVLTATGAAVAQEPVYDYDQEVVEAPEPIKIGFALGGGVAGFTDDTMRNTTDPGGNWTARVIFGMDSPIGLEASYIGSAQAIDALGLDNDAVLIGNGVQGAVRLGPGLDMGVEPFIFAGLAWRRYDIVNTDSNTSALLDSDDVAEVPLGVGIGGDWSGFMIDLRGEYRYTFDADMVPSANVDVGDADMHRWGVNLSLGYSM